MGNKLALTAAGGVLAVLVATNPYVAEAAGRITGDDIVNGTVTTKDLKDGTVKSVDVRNGSLTEADLADGTIPAGGVAAYGHVHANGESPVLMTSASHHVVSVTWTNPGRYCLELAARVDPTVAAVATVDWNGTTFPEAAASVMYNGTCGTNGVAFLTERFTVESGAYSESASSTISFTFIVP
jgi:hypothetical protein